MAFWLLSIQRSENTPPVIVSAAVTASESLELGICEFDGMAVAVRSLVTADTRSSSLFRGAGVHVSEVSLAPLLGEVDLMLSFASACERAVVCFPSTVTTLHTLFEFGPGHLGGGQWLLAAETK